MATISEKRVWLIVVSSALLSSGCYTTSSSTRRASGALPKGISAYPVAPPRLGPKLERHYERLRRLHPQEARSGSQRGSATLKIRILPTGHVDFISVLQETPGLFTHACHDMLADTIWQPALDMHGRPVAVDVKYLCTIEPEADCWFCAKQEDPESL
jgi:hypothetical protein